MNKVAFLSGIGAVIISVILLRPSTDNPPFAELLVTNAVIYTSDPSLPFADSMAISGGRILGVGNFSSLKPTGLLIDAAMQLVLQFVPQPSIDERREGLLRASGYALTKGVTTVVDMGRYFPGASTESPWQDFTDIYSWATKSGNKIIRVCLFFPIETWSRLAELKKRTDGVVNQWLYLGGVKAFMDGSLGSNSALFYEPYVDDPKTSGLQVMDLDSLANMTVSSDNSGLQVAIHAIGDKANDMILDMYESVAHTNGIKDRRFRIEHAQHLAPYSAVRFGKQGVVASVQPQHLLDDANHAAMKLGEERAEKGSYLFHTLKASHSLLAFGSDWPVADIDPMNSIRAAVKRVPPSWEAPWIPSERVTFNDALDAHTISAARACHLDKNIGSLSRGKLADFVVLSTNSWENLEELAFDSIEATYVGGVEAYSGKIVM